MTLSFPFTFSLFDYHPRPEMFPGEPQLIELPDQM